MDFVIQRFRVTGTLGTGGMGTVYRAHDPQLARDVAIKLLSASAGEAVAEIPEQRTLDLRGAGTSTVSLLDEARMMARLSHPNVVAVYEVGQHDGAVFVVMELVEGIDLRSWLGTQRGVAEIVDVFVQAGRGLTAAHAHDVVHRDFKPENVLIGDDGRVRVADFGLSRLTTTTGMVRVSDTAGTPRYLAPEIWAGQSATTAADVYAFCLTLVEAFGVDGRADDAAEKLRATQMPLAMRDAVIAGLAEDPARRPSIAAIVRALGERSRGRRTLWIGGGALVASATGIAIALASTSSEQVCELRPLGEGWEAVRPLVKPDALREDLDEIATALATERVTTCKTVTDPAAIARRDACVTKRAIELVAWSRGIVDKPRTDGVAVRAPATAAASCLELDVPPVAASPELYARYDEIDTLKPEAAVAEAEAVAAEATRRGDLELACRAEYVRAVHLRSGDRITDAAAAFDKTYQCALAIKSVHLQTITLAEHAMTESSAAHLERASALAELAVKHVDAPGVGMRDRVIAYRALGRTRSQTGNYAAALEPQRKAIEIANTSTRVVGDIDVIVRIELAQTYNRLERNVEALEVARDALARATKVIGPRSRVTAAAAMMVARVYTALNEHASAVTFARQALDSFVASVGLTHSQTRDARWTLASSLHEAGAAQAAYVEAAIAQVQKGGRKLNVSIDQARFAWITYDIGKFDEGLELFDAAIEQLAADRGIDHASTLKFRTVYAEYLIESGRLDDAARELTAVEALRKKRDDTNDRRESAVLRGELRAWILRARGRFAEAEAISKRALAELAELGAAPGDRAGPAIMLAALYADQHRYAEAQTLAGTLLAEARGRKERDDLLARLEIVLARSEIGLGRRDEGLARARGAQQVLERFLGQRTARAEVARLLAAKPANHRR